MIASKQDLDALTKKVDTLERTSGEHDYQINSNKDRTDRLEKLMSNHNDRMLALEKIC